MKDRLDDLLEVLLRRLDQGEPVERIILSLPIEQAELAPLLRTAARTRAARHPQMNPLVTRSQQQRLARLGEPALLDRLKAMLGGVPRLTRFAILGLFVLGLVVAAVLAISSPQDVRAATLANMQGIVEVASSPSATDWNVVADGQQIYQGEVVRTRLDSSATLVYFDGSRTQVGPDSSLEISQLSGGPGSALRLELRQIYGTSSHDVVKLHGSSPFYRVLTPAGVAVVHGTSFNVDASLSGSVFYAVNHGKVAVSQGQSTVYLTAGQATLAQPAGLLSDPSYEFVVQGAVGSIDGENWVVASVPVQVSAGLADGFQVGDIVVVRGRIVDGVFVADLVTLATEDSTSLHFTGAVESIADSQWVINGIPVDVSVDTRIDNDIQVGDAVKVAFSVQSDGSWLASDIVKLEQPGEESPTPAETETGSGTALPTGTLAETTTPEETLTATQVATETGTVTVEPTEVETESETPTMEPSETPEVTPTPKPTEIGGRAGCDLGGWKHPEGTRLSDRWKVSYEEIMGWFCKGYGFGEIDLAYEIAHDCHNPVTDVFDQRASGLGWGQVKREFQSQAASQPTNSTSFDPRNPNSGPSNQDDSPGHGNGGNGQGNGNGRNGGGNNDRNGNGNGRGNGRGGRP